MNQREMALAAIGELRRQLLPLTPQMAWPLLLAAAICHWTAIAPRRLQQRK